MRYFGVRRTADELGVHENTIRRWENQGIISAVRLPGSNFRRFTPDEIERVRRDMYQALERDHSMATVSDDAAVVSGELDETLWDS